MDTLAKIQRAKNVFDGICVVSSHDLLIDIDNAQERDEYILTCLAYGKSLPPTTTPPRPWVQIVDDLYICVLRGYPYNNLDDIFDELLRTVASIPETQQDGTLAFSVELIRAGALRRRRQQVQTFLSIPRQFHGDEEHNGNMAQQIKGWLLLQTAAIGTQMRQRIHRMVWFRLLPPGHEHFKPATDPFVLLQQSRGIEYVRAMTKLLTKELRDTTKSVHIPTDSWELTVVRECYALVMLDCATQCVDQYTFVDKHVYFERDIGIQPHTTQCTNMTCVCKHWHIEQHTYIDIFQCIACLAEQCNALKCTFQRVFET